MKLSRLESDHLHDLAAKDDLIQAKEEEIHSLEKRIVLQTEKIEQQTQQMLDNAGRRLKEEKAREAIATPGRII